jgi:hypothetical protein
MEEGKKWSNLFTIRDHNVVNIFVCSVVRELLQVMLDSIGVVDVQKTAFWLPEQTRIVLNCIAFCWSINHAEHFLEMVAYKLVPKISIKRSTPEILEQRSKTYAIVQDLVLGLHTGHEGVFGQIIRPLRVLLICASHLLVECLHIGRQQAMQVKVKTLLCRKCGSLVEIRIVK